MRTCQSRPATNPPLRFRALVAALLAACTPVGAQELTAAATTSTWAVAGYTEAVIGVKINGETVSEGSVVLRNHAGDFYLPLDAVTSWHLAVPRSGAEVIAGNRYYPLSAFPFTSAVFDPVQQVLSLTAPPDLFVSSRVVVAPQARPVPMVPGWGGFLNYDLSAADTAGHHQGIGLTTLGVYSPVGVVTDDQLFMSGGASGEHVRLDTTFTRDFPDSTTSLKIGDATTQPGAWGYATRFGGVQFGTDFTTNPGLVTIPLATVGGQAVVPSTVDVYVNNALTTQKQVPAGPFAISDLPVVTGNGQVTLVVRDLLGNEQIITQSFASNIQLLRAGLSAYSFEVGAIRNNYGVQSNNYGPAMASATYRYGFTNSLTAELHGEGEHDFGNLGASLAAQLGTVGTFLGTVAGSGGQNGSNGSLEGAGFERFTQGLSVSAHVNRQSSTFEQVGASNLISAPTNVIPGGESSATVTGTSALPLVVEHPRLSADASASYSFGRFGSLGVAWVSRRYYDAPRIDVTTLNYSTGIGGRAFLGAVFQHTMSSPGGNSVSVYLTFPLDANISASVTHQESRSNGTTDQENYAQVQRSLPFGEGYGYLLQASDRGDTRIQGEYQNAYGTYIAEAEHVANATNTRLEVQGGIVNVGGSTFFTRPVVDSFALVRAPDAPNARVYESNQEVGRTNSAGELLLPNVRPYENNEVSLEQLDLGLDVQFDTLSLKVVPYRLSGAIASFTTHKEHAAVVRVTLADGTPLPAGAELRRDQGPYNIPVGQNGTVYFTDLAEVNHFEARWEGHTCSITLEDHQLDAIVPDLGTVVCQQP